MFMLAFEKRLCFIPYLDSLKCDTDEHVIAGLLLSLPGFLCAFKMQKDHHIGDLFSLQRMRIKV